MQVEIKKWGNSAGIILSPAILSDLKAKVGDRLEADVVEGTLKIKPAKPVYTLAELLAQCDPSAPMPDDMQAWLNDAPVGREVW